VNGKIEALCAMNSLEQAGLVEEALAVLDIGNDDKAVKTAVMLALITFVYDQLIPEGWEEDGVPDEMLEILNKILTSYHFHKLVEDSLVEWMPGDDTFSITEKGIGVVESMLDEESTDVVS